MNVSGCNFYCQAEVENPDRIMVSVGLGFFLEMTLDEALLYIAREAEKLFVDALEKTKSKKNRFAGEDIENSGGESFIGTAVTDLRYPCFAP